MPTTTELIPDQIVAMSPLIVMLTRSQELKYLTHGSWSLVHCKYQTILKKKFIICMSNVINVVNVIITIHPTMFQQNKFTDLEIIVIMGYLLEFIYQSKDYQSYQI